MTWVVGEGLKLQATPNLIVLESEGINDFTKEARDNFARITEARHKIYINSRQATYSENEPATEQEKEALKNTMIGGDVLCVLRVEKGNLTTQLIDGQHIQTPFAKQVSNEGNQIVHGVEINKKGKHVAFHVRKAGLPFTWSRIPARGARTGQLQAFMLYGSKYRLDSTRGMPLVATVLETLKKLERYKEATVGSAEERQKIVYQIVHGANSTGESPLMKRLAVASDPEGGLTLPADSSGRTMARTVAVSTDKQTFNMERDSELKQLESKNELYFKDFYDTNFDIVCSALGIPPNVARMLYNDSFSASRAALKDWEHTLRVHRKKFSAQFNQNVYNYWLWTEVLNGKVPAPGFLDAYVNKNNTVLAAIASARWVGAQVPHIDPLKEAKAEREKLGPLGANIPLTTAEDSSEALGTGEAEENMTRFRDELNKMEELDLPIKDEPIVAAAQEI